MGGSKRPVPHRGRRTQQPLPPTITGFARPSSRRTHPTSSVKEAPPLRITPRDASEARTQVDPKNSGVRSGVVSSARAQQVYVAQDNTSAKLLVIASLMSLVVVVLSLAVLSKTTSNSAPVVIETKAPLKIETVPAAPTEKQQQADLMLSLDVEPKNASLVVQPTKEGFEVKVAASGYQPETRVIEKGVKGQIAVKLEPAAKSAAAPKKKPVRKKRPSRRKSVAKKQQSDAEVFLTGSDL